MPLPLPRARAAAVTVLAASLALPALPAGVAVAQTPSTVELQVLGINDFHGHLDPGAGSAPSVAGVLGGAVKALRAENPNTVFVSAGDNIGASPFLSSSQKDEPTLDALNTMGLAASAVGNHEFDRGYADLAGRVVPRARFPFLGANVEGESPALPEQTVVTTPSGVRIGLVGVVTQDTASLVAPSGIAGITFSDPVTAANRVARQLSDGDAANGEADVVVLLAHEGAATAAPTGSSNAASCAAIAGRDDAFGRIVRDTSADVDAILGGHTHLNVDCEFPLAGGQVRPVLEAAEYGTRLDRLRLTYDTAARRVTAASGDVLPLTATGGTFPYATDPAVEAVVDAAEAKAAEIGREVIGSVTEDVARAKTASGAEDRGTESLLGNFIADVQLAATAGAAQPGGPARIALMNPGGLRADLLFARQEAGEQPGQITYAEAAVVQPFANTLFTLTLTGAQLEQVLEEQYQPAGSSRPFLALGVSRGLRYELDGTAPVGGRISAITLDGAPVSPTATYRVVTNSFLASGGDNFRTLAGGTDRRDTGRDDLAVLVEHLRANSPITPDKTDRSVVKALPTAAPTTAPSATPTATATATTSPSATPTTAPSASAPAIPSATPVTDVCAGGVAFTYGPTTLFAGGGRSTVTVPALTAGANVTVRAYTRPSTTYRTVRTAVGTGGDVVFELVPSANTRFVVERSDCRQQAPSAVITVRSLVSINAVRTGARTYAFSGRVLPSRAGQTVSLYRQTSAGEVLTAQTRTGADGVWRVERRFLGSGQFGLVARTGTDLTNAAGSSRVRPTVIH